MSDPLVEFLRARPLRLRPDADASMVEFLRALDALEPDQPTGPPDPSTVDEARLRAVLAYIEAHPESWNQGEWACGTSGCLAGWTVALDRELEIRHVAVTYHGSQVEETARKLLRLDPSQAAWLFYFTSVEGDDGEPRRPTFEEFCARVEQVTGVRYKPLTHLTEADYAG